MDKKVRIVLGIFVFFLLIDLWLGFRYWSLTKTRRIERIKNIPTPIENIPTSYPSPKAILSPILPPPGKLLHPLVAGIQHHKAGNGDVYELVGWVTEANEQKREISVGQGGTPLSRKIVIPPEAVIRLVLVEENGNLQHLPKSFADLVPGKVRVVILCKEADCLEAEIVSIIETKN